MMWRLLAAGTAIGAALNAATAEPVLIQFFGIGSRSCAHWQSTPSRQIAGSNWIFGYWTGTNVASLSNSPVGESTDGEGLLAEVKKVCDAQPSMRLMDAVSAVYYKTAKKQ